MKMVAVFVVLTAMMQVTCALPPISTRDGPAKLHLQKNFNDKSNASYFEKKLIFTAKDPTYFSFQPVSVIGESNWTFGPVFKNNVLHEVYAIQDHLINMTAYGTSVNGTIVEVTLGDICLQPRAPFNKDCTILSVLGYFQNNLTHLDLTHNFGLINNSYHIHYCTRNPYSQRDAFFQYTVLSCLGAFGMPVTPYDALRGFNENDIMPDGFPNFDSATQLVVTFVFKKTNVQLVKIWENALSKYIDTLVTDFTLVTEEPSIEKNYIGYTV